MPVLFFVPCRDREEWPTTQAFGILEEENTRIFRRYPVGTYPHGWRLFLTLFFEDAALPKADATQ
jgi:hypothetical protein